MKISAMYSHLNGFEWIKYHKAHLWDELEQVIHEIDANQLPKKISKEIRMQGEMKFSPKEMNKAFESKLEALDWHSSITNYWVTDDYKLIVSTLNLSEAEQKEEIFSHGKIPIRSYNQTDFVKEKVAIEVQFGKYSFIAYDLFVKHLAFYVGDKIDVGIEILPMKSLQSQMSSGPGYYEGALYDLARQGRGVPAVPLILLGIEP